MGAIIDDYAAIATMSIVMPGVRVGKGALVGAHSSVARDVEPDTVVAGAPAKFICETSKLKLKDGLEQTHIRGASTSIVATLKKLSQSG